MRTRGKLGWIGAWAMVTVTAGCWEAASRDEAPATAELKDDGAGTSPTEAEAHLSARDEARSGGGGRLLDVVAPAATAAARVAESAPGGAAAEVLLSGVKSGEWDDNANYRDFLGYLRTAPLGGQVDVSKRRFVVVRDVDGRPVPNCAVELRHDDRVTRLVTTSSGRALFFPGAEGGPTRRVRAATACAGGADASFDVEHQDGMVELHTAAPRELGDDRTVDLVFVLDTTGSMSEEIAALVATIEKVTEMLAKERVSARLGLVEYKDRGDVYRTQKTAFTTDVGAFLQTLRRVHASGGGDLPEDMNEGLRVAVEEMAWEKESVARLAFVIADAPPHLDYQDGRPFQVSALAANHAGIVVHTVAASGMDGVGQSVFRQVAQLTGGSTMFVLRGGAGKSSVGGGDPRSSCGGAHQSYKSGDLHQLVSNKVYAAISAVDRDPTKIAGLAKDEDAKPCAERVQQVVWTPGR